MATWADVEALGYTVGEARPGVFFVSGDGLATYVASDDQAQIDSLADPTLHAERIAPPELTLTATPAPAAAIPQLDPKTATLADVVATVNELTASG
jgi:DNA-binding helix-hairpin-helix protein with protein kinase domain